MKEGFDVKALRAFRVLRPLRLVSGVPSKFSNCKTVSQKNTFRNFSRFTSRHELYSSCNGAIVAYCTFGYFCYNYLCNCGTGAIFWKATLHLL